MTLATIWRLDEPIFSVDDLFGDGSVEDRCGVSVRVVAQQDNQDDEDEDDEEEERDNDSHHG